MARADHVELPVADHRDRDLSRVQLMGCEQIGDQVRLVGEAAVVARAVNGLEARSQATLTLPSRAESWLTLGADPCLADGSTPFEAVLELRTARTATTAPAPAGGFDATRLAPWVTVDGAPYDGTATLTSAAPGAWLFTVRLPAGLGERTLTLGATFDGVDIVDPKSVPIAVDATTEWSVPTVSGGCAVGASGSAIRRRGFKDSCRAIGCVLGVLVLCTRRRRHVERFMAPSPRS